jgi:hypothetical protein
MQLLSKSELARLKGCHKSQVTRATAPGGPLHAATISGRVDLDHQNTKRWLSEPDGAPTRKPLPLSETELDAITDVVFDRLLARLVRALREPA